MHLAIDRRPRDTSPTSPSFEWKAQRQHPSVHTTILDQAIGALREIVIADGVEPPVAAKAARLLRGAALERRVSAPRVAGIALLVSDALLFTDLDAMTSAQRAPLRHAMRVLSEPFVAQSDESRLVDGLLDNGWDVTASLDGEAFGVFMTPEGD